MNQLCQRNTLSRSRTLTGCFYQKKEISNELTTGLLILRINRVEEYAQYRLVFLTKTIRMKKLMLFLIPLISLMLIVTYSCKDDEEVVVEICDNLIDDDNDGQIDCMDDDCFGINPCGFPSDLRLKEDITPVGYGLNAILKMDPVKYKYLDEEVTHLGLIAQQLQEILPEVVVDNPRSDQDMLAIRYEEIIPVLIKPIQEQQRMIDMLMVQNSEFIGEAAP